LAALHVGWNLNFVFLLDADRQGIQEQRRYTSEFGIAAERVVTLEGICSQVSVIEDLLDNVALKAIATSIGVHGTPTKDQIRRFFQERLASNKVEPLSDEFLRVAALIVEGLEVRLGIAPSGSKRTRRARTK
jgi:hypothetical protein